MPEIFLPHSSGPVAVQGTSFVIVGANGSGKSQLGAWIEQQGGGRRQSHRISAQRALQMREFIDPVPLERAERRLYYGTDDESASIGHKWGSRWGNDLVGHLLDDFHAVLASLLAHEAERDARYVKASRVAVGGVQLKVPNSRLDTLKAIWQQVLPHRSITFDGGKIVASVVDNPAQQYPGRKMSDGERVLIYLTGQALCAPQSALLIIDEPEIHLHRAIRERLWDAIEKERPDSLFVFITHDLEFAASRASATTIWVKSFDASKGTPAWEWEECPKDTDLPVELVLQVLGSRKPVVFVEGNSVSSLDAKLYKLVYPEHRVIPVGNATTVDKCVTALRNLPSLHHVRPQGIVDRDHRSIEEIASLAQRGIACCPFAEVENLLVDETVVAAVAARANAPDPSVVTTKVRQAVLAKLQAECRTQAAQWGEAAVAHRLAGFSCKDMDADSVSAAVREHVKRIDVPGIYAVALKNIDAAVAAGDYEAALRVFNQKGLIALASAALDMKADAYERMALAAVRDDFGVRERLAKLVPLSD